MSTEQKPPSAILMDLDDTIISAYGQPLRVWTKVAQEFTSLLAPADPLEIAYAIGASAEEFWACPVRHKEWRGNLMEARRKIAAGALAQFPSAVPFADALADRFSAIRGGEMHVFPGARDALRRLKGLRIKLALIANGAGAVQRAKLARFKLTQYFDHIQIESELGFGKLCIGFEAGPRLIRAIALN
jgi:putative hydrolase of the HAD superfamily